MQSSIYDKRFERVDCRSFFANELTALEEVRTEIGSKRNEYHAKMKEGLYSVVRLCIPSRSEGVEIQFDILMAELELGTRNHAVIFATTPLHCRAWRNALVSRETAGFPCGLQEYSEGYISIQFPFPEKKTQSRTKIASAHIWIVDVGPATNIPRIMNKFMQEISGSFNPFAVRKPCLSLVLDPAVAVVRPTFMDYIRRVIAANGNSRRALRAWSFMYADSRLGPASFEFVP